MILSQIFRLLYHITGIKQFRKIYKYNYKLKNNKIILIENGMERILPPYSYINGVDIQFLGSNNKLEQYSSQFV